MSEEAQGPEERDEQDGMKSEGNEDGSTAGGTPTPAGDGDDMGEASEEGTLEAAEGGDGPRTWSRSSASKGCTTSTSWTMHPM